MSSPGTHNWVGSAYLQFDDEALYLTSNNIQFSHNLPIPGMDDGAGEEGDDFSPYMARAGKPT